jgi:hypothetical protein
MSSSSSSSSSSCEGYHCFFHSKLHLAGQHGEFVPSRSPGVAQQNVIDLPASLLPQGLIMSCASCAVNACMCTTACCCRASSPVTKVAAKTFYFSFLMAGAGLALLMNRYGDDIPDVHKFFSFKSGCGDNLSDCFGLQAIFRISFATMLFFLGNLVLSAMSEVRGRAATQPHAGALRLCAWVWGAPVLFVGRDADLWHDGPLPACGCSCATLRARGVSLLIVPNVVRSRGNCAPERVCTALSPSALRAPAAAQAFHLGLWGLKTVVWLLLVVITFFMPYGASSP